VSLFFRIGNLSFLQNKLWYPRQDSRLEFGAREITGRMPVTLAINQNARLLFTDVDPGADRRRDVCHVRDRSRSASGRD